MKGKNPIGRGRGPVVHLDRTLKAQMIEAFLEDALGGSIQGKRILDIGSGNGDISEYFSVKNSQYSVDVKDLRRNKDTKVDFFVVDSEDLPFEDHYFDIVISSHVIEHVHNQGKHLDEIHRVLKVDGVGYIGTPNRTSPIMEGHINNNSVLAFRQMVPLFQRHHFEATLLSVKLMKQPFKYHCEIELGRFLPSWGLKILQPLFPSQSFLVWPKRQP